VAGDGGALGYVLFRGCGASVIAMIWEASEASGKRNAPGYVVAYYTDKEIYTAMEPPEDDANGLAMRMFPTVGDAANLLRSRGYSLVRRRNPPAGMHGFYRNT